MVRATASGFLVLLSMVLLPGAGIASAGDLRLTVVDPAGRPVADAAVRLATGSAETRSTDATGSVELPRSGSGAFRLGVHGTGRVEPFAATIPAGVTSFRVVLPPPARRRTVEVSDGRGVPLPGLPVALGSGWIVGRTDERGRLGLAGGFEAPVELRLAPSAAAVDEVVVVPPVEGGSEREGAVLRSPLPVALVDDSIRVTLAPGGVAFGRILDERERPLPGARVTLTPAGTTDGETEPLHATTGPDGRFLVPAVAFERFDLRAAADGFAPVTLKRMERAAGPDPADLGTLVLQPEATIAGRAVTPTGEPVPGVEVRFREAVGRPGRSDTERLSGEEPAATGGPDGRFVLGGLAAGRPVDLLSSAEGHVAAWTLAVTPPREEPLTVVLEPAASLAGRLVDDEGRPVPEGRVTLSWKGSPPGTVGVRERRGGGTRTRAPDETGRFRFEELEAGEVAVEAHVPGFLPSEPVVVELAPGEVVEDLSIGLRRGAVIEGLVTDARGEPVAGANLRAGPVRASSGEDGTFRLVGIPEGVLGLFAYHPGYRPLALEVGVAPGVNRVALVFEEGLLVSGRAIDGTGGPVAGARIALRPEGPRGGMGFQATSSADGAFRLVVGEVGTYGLVATREGFAPGQIGGLRVGPEGLEELEVTLTAGAALTGEIRGLGLDDLATLRVEAELPGAGVVPGSVDFAGRYLIEHLVPGDWHVRAEVAGGRREARAVVTVPEGAETVELDLDLGAGLVLTGTLRHAGEPISGAHVVLVGRSVTAHRSVATGWDGTFRIDDLEPGGYRIDMLDPSRALSHVEDLELASDRNLAIDLDSAPLVGAVLSEATGEPLADALVTVRKIFGPGETGSLITVGTDAAGGFTVAHLTPARYLVGATKDGYTPADVTVEMLAGGPASEPVLRLATAAGLTITARFRSGALPGLLTLSAFRPSGEPFLTVTKPVSDRGFSHVGQLPAGSWNLLVSSEGAAPQWVSAQVPGTLDLVLDPAAPLTVRVPALRTSGGTGRLTIAGADGAPFFQVEPSGVVRSAWAVEAGLAHVPDVPAGVWTVRVVGTGGTVWTTQAATDGSGPREVRLE